MLVIVAYPFVTKFHIHVFGIKFTTGFKPRLLGPRIKNYNAA